MDLSGVDVEDLIVRLDLKNARLSSSGLELNFSCFGPEHSHGDESPSAYINVESTAYFCHGCKRRGNAVTLVMEAQQVSKATAERELREWYGISFLEPAGGSMVAETDARFAPIQPQPEPIPAPESWLISARVDWDYEWEHRAEAHGAIEYMFDRGFLPSTLLDWEIGYDYVSDRITIPVRATDGTLVGIKGRAWRPDHQPKYLILGDTPRVTSYGFMPYLAADVVYGLHRGRDHKIGVLCEGELNADALSQLGVRRPFATGMSYFTDRHAQLVARELDEVVIYYDYGEAGYEGTWGRVDAAGKFRPGAVAMLEPYVRVRVAQAAPEDPAKLMQLGRGSEALAAIEDAPSSIALRLVFR